LTQPTDDDLEAILLLDSIKGFGPQKFKALHQAGISPRQVVNDPSLLPFESKTGEKLKAALARGVAVPDEAIRARAAKQLESARKLGVELITYDSPAYPSNVYRSNNPIPLLFARGSLRVLANHQTIAAVGSRKIRAPYDQLHRAVAIKAVKSGFAVVSGFALGADTIGHRAAHEADGQTIVCMPGGLDRPFPPENRSLWLEFLESERVCFVSEFPLGTGASSLTLRKRNKLIVAFALGVLVSQSAAKGGAMNAFRFAAEQKKPVATFEPDSTPDTSGNREISENKKTPVKVFSISSPGLDQEVGSWLRELSSLT
jgi:DNA processing protein